MTRQSNPPAACGGFFVTRNSLHNFAHTVCSALALGLFVIGGVLFLAGVS